MKRFRDHLRDWFGFTRRERRATFTLLLIILSVGAVRYAVPDRSPPLEVSLDSTYARPVSANAFLNDASAGGEPYKRQNVQVGVHVQESRKKMSLIDINSCDSASLEALPGIGPVLSVRIIRYRNLLGGYASVDQLREVYGLPEETFALIRGRVFADSLAIIKIRINEAQYRELLRFPYLEKHEVDAISKYRELEGRITGMRDLIHNRLIDSVKAGRIRPYLEFGIQ
ncbi:MAG TPA: helix-hairpin-helix domain-containing protein [Bacteroidales bacterium]|nr:helix-hairpin-helix domain-containing protein [Bacteroidales bacterium]